MSEEKQVIYLPTSKEKSSVRDECIELFVNKKLKMFENVKYQQQIHFHHILNFSKFITTLENKTS